MPDLARRVEIATASKIVVMLRATSETYHALKDTTLRDKYCPGLDYATNLIVREYKLNGDNKYGL